MFKNAIIIFIILFSNVLFSQTMNIYSTDGSVTHHALSEIDSITFDIPSVVPSKGLIAHYSFEGNINDVSGNNNHCTSNEGAILAPDRFGKSNGAYEFDGQNDKIVTPIINTFSNQFSICVWYKARTSSNDGSLISSRSLSDGGYNYSGIDITNNSGNSVIFSKSYGDAVAIEDLSFRDNNWHFVVGTYNGTVLKIYGDGILLASKSTSGEIEDENYYIIGYDNGQGSNNYFNGFIDDIKLYDVELSSEEITTLYDSFGNSGIDDGLIFGDFGITDSSYSYDANIDEICNSIFGTGYRVADWTDLETYYSNGNDLLTLFDGLGLTEYRSSAAVKNNGVQFYSSSRAYFAERHEHNLPSGWLAHDNIDNYLISLGSWYGTRKIMVIKK